MSLIRMWILKWLCNTFDWLNINTIFVPYQCRKSVFKFSMGNAVHWLLWTCFVLILIETVPNGANQTQHGYKSTLLQSCNSRIIIMILDCFVSQQKLYCVEHCGSKSKEKRNWKPATFLGILLIKAPIFWVCFCNRENWLLRATTKSSGT